MDYGRELAKYFGKILKVPSIELKFSINNKVTNKFWAA
jgi:hypothetical protein